VREKLSARGRAPKKGMCPLFTEIYETSCYLSGEARAILPVMRKLVFIGLTSIVTAGSIALWAQDAQPAAKAAKPSPYISTIGEVTGVDTAGKKLTIKPDAGEPVSVPLDDKTHYLKIAPGEKDLKKAVESQESELKVGDRVSARSRKLDDGTLSAATTVLLMTKEELAKHQEQSIQQWQTNGLTGTVTLVNPATKEVTMKLIASDPKQVVIEPNDKVNVRRYAADSIKFSDAKPSSVAEIKTGDTIRVLGKKNEESTRVTPDEIIYGTFVRQAGTILSIDAAAGTLSIKDLTTKKPVLVKVNASTVQKKLPEMMAQRMARMQQGGSAGGPGAGAPGAGGQGGPPQGGNPQGGRPQGQGMAGGGMPPGASSGRAPGGTQGEAPGGTQGGGPGGMRGQLDPARILERAPSITLADLKVGDAVMVSSSSSGDLATITAITLVAGVEPLLTAPTKPGQQQAPVGSWNFEMSIPQ
jgi:Cu/Ag efflux protein CusF